MLTHLDFKLSSPTAVNYLNVLGATLVAQLPLEDSVVVHFAHYLVELSYLQRQFLEFTPSELAAAALYVGLEFLNRPVLEHIQKVRACSTWLRSLASNANTDDCSVGSTLDCLKTCSNTHQQMSQNACHCCGLY